MPRLPHPTVAFILLAVNISLVFWRLQRESQLSPPWERLLPARDADGRYLNRLPSPGPVAQNLLARPRRGAEISCRLVEDDEDSMFAWILILTSWATLLLLILHDATKEDRDGSAISIAAKKIKAMLKAGRRTLSYRTSSQRAVSEPPAKVVTAVSAISSSAEVIRRGGPTVNKQVSAPQPKKRWRHSDRRVSMTAPELELAISEAVKNAAPGYADFIGVIVHYKAPKSRFDPNWAIRGVKFGRADRKVAEATLATVVERMQREFLLSND